MNWPAVSWYSSREKKETEDMIRRIKEIVREDETQFLYTKIHHSGKIPDFLYHDKRYRPVVLEFLKDEISGGLLYGIVESETDRFFLHHLQMTKECATVSDICYFVEKMNAVLREKYNVKEIIITKVWSSSEIRGEIKETALSKIFRKVPGCEIEKTEYLRQFGILTGDFEYLRKFRWYYPEFVKKQGCYLLPWKDLKESVKKQLILEERENRTDSDYVSSGVGEDDWTYDEKTSFALIKKDSEKLIGWIITEALNDKVVKLRRFYIYDKERKLNIGPAFVTGVLDVISQFYEEMWYEVVPGNRQMECFTENFCKEILTFNNIKCVFYIKLLTF